MYVVTVKLNKKLSGYHIQVSTSFIPLLQYDTGDEVVCMKLSTLYENENVQYCTVVDFISHENLVEVSVDLMRILMISEGDLIQVEQVSCPNFPDIISIRAHNESFGNVSSIKERLENVISSMRILHLGDVLEIKCPDICEPFTVEKMVDKNGSPMDMSCVVNTEVKIDFLRTVESIKREEAEIDSETNGGYLLGGVCLSREEQIAKFEKLVKNKNQ